jgi:hypothetical protein
MKSIILLLISTISLSIYGQVQNITIDINSSIKITGTIKAFEVQKHKIDTCDTGLGWKSICLIDNKPVFGTDNDMPDNQLINLTIIIKNKEIPLNVDYMFNPNFELHKEQFKIKKCEVGQILTGIFSDGAGTYMVQWKIIKNKSFRFLITNDESIILKSN